MNTATRRQDGAISILYALMLPAIIGCAGLAIDLGLFYLRKAQLQNVADSIALAAAQKLNGTAAGITAADNSACDIAVQARVGLGTLLRWNSNALTFASAPDAPESEWQTAGALGTTASAGARYARVDLRVLSESMRSMQPMFLGVVGVSAETVNLGTVAVAGPTALAVTPLAICAMSTKASDTRTNPGTPDVAELVNYGFRFGVGYNLLNLNPGGTTAEYFLVDPIHAPGAGGTFSETSVAPFMCAGMVAYPVIGTGTIGLRRPGAFNQWQQLNSRFNIYAGAPACNPVTAPPDRNIKNYTGANANWMNQVPTNVTADSTTASGTLRTIADAAPSPPPSPLPAPGKYGIRWAYGPAKTPAGGNLAYTTFATLYPANGANTLKSGYPAAGPYTTGGSSYGVTVATGQANRRLLNIPLLNCATVGTGAQTHGSVVAIARFFLTAPASATEVPGEFAGIVTEARLPAAIGLHR